MPFLTIAFPVFNPIAISIGPIAIRWYALAYIASDGAMRGDMRGLNRRRWVRTNQARTYNGRQQCHFSSGSRDFHGAPCELDVGCSAHEGRSVRARSA